MKISQHVNTTPKTRAYIQSSDKSAKVLAEELGVNVDTIYPWRKRDSTHDLSHTPHNLNPSTTPEQEVLIAGLRTDLALSIDDIIEVMNRCLNLTLSSSSVGPCLRRLGVSKPAKPKSEHQTQPFEATKFA